SHSAGGVSSLLCVRRVGGLVLGAYVCCLATPLTAQNRSTMTVEATVLPAEGTRTFQLVRQMLNSTRASTIAGRRPGDPLPVATIAIDSMAAVPGFRPCRVVVNIQYLEN
ncbi:MAG: hypothetical protein ACHQ2E_10500, partial [Gemmatimonadales bacterium]